VSILDAAGNIQATSDPVTDTITDGRVKWRKGQGVVGLRGEKIRLRFQLRNAKSYSFQIKGENCYTRFWYGVVYWDGKAEGFKLVSGTDRVQGNQAGISKPSCYPSSSPIPHFS
jgi:hypothetical protein